MVYEPSLAHQCDCIDYLDYSRSIILLFEQKVGQVRVVRDIHIKNKCETTEGDRKWIQGFCCLKNMSGTSTLSKVLKENLFLMMTERWVIK